MHELCNSSYVYEKEYDGEHRRGQKHGKGKLYFADGTVYVGEFVEGKVNKSLVIDELISCEIHYRLIQFMSNLFFNI